MRIFGRRISGKALRRRGTSLVSNVTSAVSSSLKSWSESPAAASLGQLGDGAKHLASFIATIPATYMGVAAYQVRAADDGWIITERGSAIPLRTFPRKLDAIREARAMAREHKAHLDVFTKQGTLQTHRSFA